MWLIFVINMLGDISYNYHDAVATETLAKQLNSGAFILKVQLRFLFFRFFCSQLSGRMCRILLFINWVSNKLGKKVYYAGRTTRSENAKKLFPVRDSCLCLLSIIL